LFVACLFITGELVDAKANDGERDDYFARCHFLGGKSIDSNSSWPKNRQLALSSSRLLFFRALASSLRQQPLPCNNKTSTNKQCLLFLVPSALALGACGQQLFLAEKTAPGKVVYYFSLVGPWPQ